MLDIFWKPNKFLLQPKTFYQSNIVIKVYQEHVEDGLPPGFGFYFIYTTFILGRGNSL